MAQGSLIQIVDENDRPIDARATVREARAKGLTHRLSRIMIENSDGDILLQKRANSAHSWPGLWDSSAGGHVDRGEDYKAAAKREMEEEIGVESDDLELLGKYYAQFSYNGNLLKRFNTLYRLKYDKTPEKIDSDEVELVRWFSLDDIKKMIKNNPEQCTPGLIEVIERYY